MTYNLYSTEELSEIHAMATEDCEVPFITRTFFPGQIVFDTPEVYVDRAERIRRLSSAPESDHEGAAPLSGYTSTAINPTLIKYRHAIEPNAILLPWKGQPRTCDLTPHERRNLIIAETLRIQHEQIMRREEMMAVEAVTKGTDTIDGATIDLGLPVSHRIDLSRTTDAWGCEEANALADFRSWCELLQNDSGYLPDVAVFDPRAWENFIKDKQAFDILYEHDADGLAKLKIAPGLEPYLTGNIGPTKVYVYQSFFTDADGTLQQMIPDNTVILGNTKGVGGNMLCGAIHDITTLVPTSRHVKMWLDAKASVEFVQTEAAPFPSLGWPKALLSAKVA